MSLFSEEETKHPSLFVWVKKNILRNKEQFWRMTSYSCKTRMFASSYYLGEKNWDYRILRHFSYKKTSDEECTLASSSKYHDLWLLSNLGRGSDSSHAPKTFRVLLLDIFFDTLFVPFAYASECVKFTSTSFWSEFCRRRFLPKVAATKHMLRRVMTYLAWLEGAEGVTHVERTNTTQLFFFVSIHSNC